MCAYKVIITKRQIKIEKVVTTPNLVRGSKEPNAKLKKPIAVVTEVRKTGIPTLRI